MNAVANKSTSTSSVMLPYLHIITTLAVCLTYTNAEAADWSSTNVQLLSGSNYQDGGSSFGNSLDDKEKMVVTLEHVSGWKYGDSFFFIDVSNPNDVGTNYYSEFAPRFSLSKLFKSNLSFPGVKDVLVATGTEWGDGIRTYLAGPGLSLNVPGFAVADFNFYTRKSYIGEKSTDLGYQATFVWVVPIDAGPAKLTLEGFADYAFGETSGSTTKENNLVAGPRFLLDVGKFLDTPGAVQAGIEYQIWRNKFGIKDVNENVAQLMLKWIL